MSLKILKILLLRYTSQKVACICSRKRVGITLLAMYLNRIETRFICATPGLDLLKARVGLAHKQESLP